MYGVFLPEEEEIQFDVKENIEPSLYGVFLPEMLYAMQFVKKVRKNMDFGQTLNNIYKYWTWMCEVYLDKTEVYMSMLEDYESENHLEK